MISIIPLSLAAFVLSRVVTAICDRINQQKKTQGEGR